MAAPTVTATLNKSTYFPGETMTLTVVTTDADTKTNTITVTGTDQSGNEAVVTVAVNVVDPVTLAVSDTNRTWVKGATTGNTTVYTATA